MKEYHVESGVILSPAAKDYLNQVHVRVLFDLPSGGEGPACREEPASRVSTSGTSSSCAGPGGGNRYYIDALTGEIYHDKPECMTHLTGNKLVYKDHARIVFRGALDHLESQIVVAQATLCGSYPEQLIDDLEDVLAFVRNLLRAEVMDEQIGGAKLLGLSSAELREQSHHPDKYFGVKPMALPHYGMGAGFAHLNLLRSQSRQVEIAAVSAFRNGSTVTNQEIVLALNRLSSGFHILCCRLLSGYYNGSG